MIMKGGGGVFRPLDPSPPGSTTVYATVALAIFKPYKQFTIHIMSIGLRRSDNLNVQGIKELKMYILFLINNFREIN